MSDNAIDWMPVCLVDKTGNPVEHVNRIQNIGTKTDYIGVPYSFGLNSILAHLNTNYYHVHGRAWTYPRLANSVVLTSGAGVWNNAGAIIEIIPANILQDAFDIHFVNATDISANLDGIIELFSGEAGHEVWLYDIPVIRNVVTSPQNQRRIQIPQQLANTRISARFSDNTAGTNTVAVKLEGHYYST